MTDSSHGVEVRVGRFWHEWGTATDTPRINESDTLELRGLDSLEKVSLGPVSFVADKHGCLRVRMLADDALRGHLGLIEISRESGDVAGELEIVPDKMSEEAFCALRAALERTWTGLIFDPGGVSRLRGVLPSPTELWQVIEGPVRDIAAEPRSVFASAERIRRMESVRRPSELTVSVVRAGQQRRAGRGRTLVHDSNIPENGLVAETLRRLASYARRQPDGAEVATRAARMLRAHPFASCGLTRGGVQTARLRTLHDSRYRRIDQVLRVLDRPEAHATEGPGEARLGVKAIIRLYEFWVFLQVLEACRDRYGAPHEPGFRILGRRNRSGTTRLGIPAGATVSFPGGVHAAFEPRIWSNGRGWASLENVPHPDRSLAQDLITPDVMVLRGGAEPSAVVFDAKHVGRRWVEFEAAKLHSRYSRIRLHGRPVVRNVLAAHPHRGIDFLWAGYGSVPMVPGVQADLGGLLP
ncbi:MAG: hypothetical protein OXC06_12635 [Acidimicrobiaceae bacterium]|nr:hypothetical protein [Acidimicrobiaceae bacterium]